MGQRQVLKWLCAVYVKQLIQQRDRHVFSVMAYYDRNLELCVNLPVDERLITQCELRAMLASALTRNSAGQWPYTN